VAGTLYVAVPVPLTLGAAQVLPGWIVNTEFNGNLSFGVMSVVTPTEPPGLVSTSLTASMTGVATVPIQFAPAGQLGSPPPVTVTVLVLGLTAVAATLTGTSMTIGPAAPIAIEQPAKLVAPAAPAVVQLPGVSVPPLVTVMPALVVMPAGRLSFSVISAVVGPLTTAIEIV
jgi:hypothetical protein